MKRLTDRQQAILAYVRLRVKRGLPPTIRDIMKIFGIKSTNAVRLHLIALERKGFIRRSPGLARGIELTGKR